MLMSYYHIFSIFASERANHPSQPFCVASQWRNIAKSGGNCEPLSKISTIRCEPSKTEENKVKGSRKKNITADDLQESRMTHRRNCDEDKKNRDRDE